MQYSNKVAVITGASRGIGAGMATVFARHAMKLGICARRIPEMPVAPKVYCVAGAVDVTNAQAVQRFANGIAAHYGPIDLWVNNAGVLDPINLMRDIDPADFKRLLDINIMGVMHGSQTFVRHRHQHGGGGVLINMSSGAAQSGYPGWSAYCASKAAVERFSEAVAAEEAEYGLRVYAVAPGVVDTEMQATIRSTPSERFPFVERFHQIKANNQFNTEEFIAEHLLAYAFDPARRPQTVVVRVPNQWE